MTIPEGIFKRLFTYYFSWDYFSHVYIDDSKDELKLMQFFLSLINEHRIFDGVFFDKQKNQFVLAEEKVDELLKDYDEVAHEFFWESLIKSLSGRDYSEKFGTDLPRDSEFEEKFEEIWKIMDRYRTEFANAGIKNLKISN